MHLLFICLAVYIFIYLLIYSLFVYSFIFLFIHFYTVVFFTLSVLWCSGAGIVEADDRQMTTVLTVRHSTNRVSRSVTIVGERRGEV